MALLTYHMTDKDVSALRDAYTEQIDEHDDVVSIGTRSQCLIADLIDKVGDNHL